MGSDSAIHRISAAEDESPAFEGTDVHIEELHLYMRRDWNQYLSDGKTFKDFYFDYDTGVLKSIWPRPSSWPVKPSKGSFMRLLLDESVNFRLNHGQVVHIYP